MEAYVIQSTSDPEKFFCTSRAYGGYTNSPRVYSNKRNAANAKGKIPEPLAWGYSNHKEWNEDSKTLVGQWSFDNYNDRESLINALRESAKEEPYWQLTNTKDL